MAIAISAAIYAPIQLLINAYPNKKLIHYSFFEQIKDIAIPLVMSVIMFICVYLLNYLSIGLLIKTIFQIVLGIGLYVAFSLIFKVPAMKIIVSKLKAFMGRK